MALPLTKFLFFFLFLVSSALLTVKSDFLSSKREKLTHFLVYVQDAIANQVNVAQASTTNQSATKFGRVGVFDDALTVGPEVSSKNVGRVQWMPVSASQTEVAFLMSMNFVFTEGKYNGSSLTIVGRNVLLSKASEMPILGGTGLFRLARGYVQASTYSSDINNGTIVLEYDFSVYHHRWLR